MLPVSEADWIEIAMSQFSKDQMIILQVRYFTFYFPRNVTKLEVIKRYTNVIPFPNVLVQQQRASRKRRNVSRR